MKPYPAQVWRNNKERRRFLGVVGVVETFSVVKQGPKQLSNRPSYILAMVGLKNEKTLVQLVDVDASKVFVGMKVVGVLRKMHDVLKDELLVYGVKFRPVKL
ncbi:OB-fold domain-containing protein [Patescibacteria group bacterium]